MCKKDVMNILKERFKENIILLLKFTSKREYAESILNGDLYMNNVQYYRDYEEKLKRKGLGDKDELVQRINFESLQLTPISNSKKNSKDVIKLKNTNSRFFYKEDSDIPMYCMMGLTINDFEVKEVNNDRVILKIKLQGLEIKDLINDFGKYVTVINYCEFMGRIITKSEENKIPVVYGKVKYCEENREERVMSFFYNSKDRFFYKDLFFKYQKEFRIITGKDAIENNFYKIGRLDEIVKIYETNNIMEMLFPVDL